MGAVSQALVDFAKYVRQPAAPGIEVIETPRYRIVLQPDFPIPGPNSVGWVRCRPHEAGVLIDEVRAQVAPRHVPLFRALDPETEPADFTDYLEARGIQPDPHGSTAAVMVFPIDAEIEGPAVAGLELKDGLADAEAFRIADAVNAEAFTSGTLDDDPARTEALERRRRNQIAAGDRRVILATVDDEPPRSAGLNLFTPGGPTISGDAVL